jgi:hypothetical protein
MFTALALAAILVTSPASCPPAQPWAIPSGSEVAPYLCVASDPGEQNPDPGHKPKPPVHHPAPKHHPKHHAPKRHIRKVSAPSAKVKR